MSNLETLFSALVVNNFNMKMLHWGSAGSTFDTYHDLASDYEKTLCEFNDDIAEIILMNADRVPTLTECIQILGDSEHKFIILGTEAQVYTRESFLENINIIFTELLDLYNCVLSDVPPEVESKLHEHMYWIRKELQYKSKKRAK